MFDQPMPYFVYMLASRRDGTLYVGVTNDLARRVHEHRTKVYRGFTSQYGVQRLVWYETYERIDEAIAREKALKKWRRDWKVALIEEHNPERIDLYEILAGRTLACLRRREPAKGVRMDTLGLDPLIALGVVLATGVTDAAYVFFNAAVTARHRIRAANWSAVWYLLSAFAVIKYTENAAYVLFAALGSWLGAYASVTWLLRRPAEATAPHR